MLRVVKLMTASGPVQVGEQSNHTKPQAAQAAMKVGPTVDVVTATEFRSLMRFPVGDATALAAAEALAAAKPTPVGTVGPRTVKVTA